MQKLISMLHEGGYSCVIARQGGEVKTCTQRGVADLYHIYNNHPVCLLNSSVADKVVGLGAAALLIAGGVKALYADVISSPALDLLQKHGINVRYSQMTSTIINRRGDGPCPIEQLCMSLQDVDDMIQAIRSFIENQ